MKWWNNKSKIPYENEAFNKIINTFVFECPSVIRKRISIGKSQNGKKKYKVEIQGVSARRNVSFKSKKITGDKLNTILSMIKKPLAKNGAYLVIDSNKNVESELNNIIKMTTLKDHNFEVIVMKERYEMPKTESIYYYIRNAFAHGSFEVINQGKEIIYKIESAKGKDVKARMRLKEGTLLEYIKFSNLTAKEIKALQKPRKNK